MEYPVVIFDRPTHADIYKIGRLRGIFNTLYPFEESISVSQ